MSPAQNDSLPNRPTDRNRPTGPTAADRLRETIERSERHMSCPYWSSNGCHFKRVGRNGICHCETDQVFRRVGLWA